MLPQFPSATFVFLSVLIAVFIILIGYLIWLFWSLRCNDKTISQRCEIISKITPHDDHRRLMKLFNAVSYQDHMNALKWLRDPYNLYPTEIRDFLSGGRV